MKITILLIRVHILDMCIHSSIYYLYIYIYNSEEVLLNEGTEATHYKFVIAKAIQCYSKISCIVADYMGRTGGRKGSLSCYGSKESSFVHMGIHCGESVT